MFRRLKLSTQLIILFGLVITLSVALSASFGLFRQSQQLRKTLEDRGRVLAELTADFLLTPLYFSQVDNVTELVNGLAQDEGVTFVIAKNATGDTIGQAGVVEGIPDSILERVAAAAQQQNDTVLVDTAGQILIAIPVRRESVNAGILTVGLSLERVQTQLRTAVVQSILAAFLWVGLGLVGTVWVAHYFTRPIHNLTEAAEAIRRGSYNISLPPANSRELDELGAIFKQMVDSVRESQMEIETRVVERTRQLETVADITGRINAILDLDQLLNELVNQVKQSFDYYHTQVYLLDTGRLNLVLRAGVGEAGAQMKAQGHYIPVDAPTSLVAQAARNNEVVNVQNVRETEDWLPNPLLPDTNSEIAVPIILEGQVVGVLDVQEDELAGLDEGDANMLRSLANQVALAIRNVQQFEQVQTALAEAQALQERYVRQSWDKSRLELQNRERKYVQPGMPESLSEAIFDAAQKQALNQKHPAIVAISDQEGSPKPLVAPVLLSGQTIGALQLHKMNSEDSSQIWTEQDLEFVETILDQVAQTAENLRLFDETQERAGREQAIREITDKLRAAPNLNTLVKVAARELGEQLGVPHLMFELGREPDPSPKPDLGGNGHKQ